MVSIIQGFDELRDSSGALLTPLGFGLQTDWELLSTKEASDSADIRFEPDDFDVTAYDQFEVVVTDLVCATDSAEFRMTVSDDGGSTYEAGTQYDYANDRWGPGIARSLSQVTGAAFIEFVRTIGNVTDEGATFTIKMGNLGGTALTKAFTLYGTTINASDSISLIWEAIGHFHGSSAALNGLKFFLDEAGPINITSGTFQLRGRRKTPVSLISQDDWVVIEDVIGISAVTTHDIFWGNQVYDEIEISAWGLVVGTDNQNIEGLLSTDGSTFLNGAADYEWSYSRSDQAANTSLEGSDAGGDTTVVLVLAMGDQADEHADVTVHLKNVSNTTRKKTFAWEWTGILQDGLFNRANGGAILRDNNSALRGFRFDGEGATTFSADRIRVRGRRLTPTGIPKQDWEVLDTWDHADTGDIAEIEWINIPSAEFDEFELTLKDLNTGTSSNTLSLNFSSDNGATWKTGASDYEYAYWNMASNSAHATTQSGAAAQMNLSANFASTSVRLLHGTLWFGPLTGGSRKHVRFLLSAINDSDEQRTQIGAGSWVGTDSDGDTTAFRLDLVAGGNFTGGRAVLRGRRKQPV